jgi:hypothetical protein
VTTKPAAPPATPVDELLMRARPGDPVRAALGRALTSWRRGVAAGDAGDVALLADACRVTRTEAIRAILATIRQAPPSNFKGAVNRLPEPQEPQAPEEQGPA